jgi:hypothetical protein
MVANKNNGGQNMDAAYDYKAQKWITGDEAMAMLQKQLRQDLELLKGPEGERFAKFINANRARAIAAIEAQLS